MTVKSYDSLIDQFPLGFLHVRLVLDEQGIPSDLVIQKVNKTLEELTQLTSRQLVGTSARKVPIRYDVQEKEIFAKVAHVALHGGFDSVDLFFLDQGRHFSISLFSPVLYDVYLLFTDITASITHFSDSDVFFQISPDLLSILTIDGRYLKVNPAWKKILGYDPSEIEGKLDTYFLHPEDHCNAQLEKLPQDTQQHFLNFSNRFRHQDGTYRVIEWNCRKNHSRIYAVGRDITERNLREAQIEYLSFHDVLTGLYNRRFLEEEAKRLDVPRNLPFTVIMGDVNRLKLVNDAFGHEKGDELIKLAAESIKSSCRPEDLIARWGGDEFIVFLPKTSNEDAQKVIDRIHATCATRTVNSITVSIAFGSATKTNQNETLTTKFREAEDAMYKSKAKEGERSRRDIIDVIAATLYSKIPFEEQHAKRVSFLCQQMALNLGFQKEDVQKLALAGLLHDIGKVAISTDILTKKTPLTQAEWQQLRTHTEIGAKVVGNGDTMSEIGQAILHHHERYDGSGYPKGIAWDEIPMAARIITIADSYDSMITQNEYKNAKSRDEAILELRQNSGTQFDPKLTELFINAVLGEHSNKPNH